MLWVVAATGTLVLLAADAQGQKVFTNTWAVRIPGGPAVANSVARKHGFLNLGQVGVLTWAAGLGTGHCQGVGPEKTGILAPGSRNCWPCLLRGIWVAGMFWVARSKAQVVQASSISQ